MNALVSNVLTQVFITLIAVSGIYVLPGLTGMFSPKLNIPVSPVST